MYDKKMLTSCTERILNIYRKNKNKENDFTLLLVSFAGLLSVLDENVRKEIFKNFSFPEWFATEKNDEDNNGETKGEYYIRHLRNSFCHFKLDPENIIPDEKNQISKVRFLDKHNGKTNFDCIMTVAQVEELFLLIIDAIKKANK